MENNGIGKLFEGVDRWTVLIYVLIVLVGFVAIPVSYTHLTLPTILRV